MTIGIDLARLKQRLWYERIRQTDSTITVGLANLAQYTSTSMGRTWYVRELAQYFTNYALTVDSAMLPELRVSLNNGSNELFVNYSREYLRDRLIAAVLAEIELRRRIGLGTICIDKQFLGNVVTELPDLVLGDLASYFSYYNSCKVYDNGTLTISF